MKRVMGVLCIVLGLFSATLPTAAIAQEDEGTFDGGPADQFPNDDECGSSGRTELCVPSQVSSAMLWNGNDHCMRGRNAIGNQGYVNAKSRSRNAPPKVATTSVESIHPKAIGLSTRTASKFYAGKLIGILPLAGVVSTNSSPTMDGNGIMFGITVTWCPQTSTGTRDREWLLVAASWICSMRWLTRLGLSSSSVPRARELGGWRDSFAIH